MSSMLVRRGHRILRKIRKDWFSGTATAAMATGAVTGTATAAMATRAVSGTATSAMATGTVSGHLVRFVEEGAERRVVFGLAPPDYDADKGDAAERLVGQRVPLVRVETENLTSHAVDWWNTGGGFGPQTTGHVSPADRIVIKPTDSTAKIGVLLCPIPVSPPAIWCIGLNYVKHWEEGAAKRGEPLPSLPSVFMKPASSVAHPGQPVWIPTPGQKEDPFSLGGKGGEEHLKVDYEGELGVVIGRACRNVTPDQVYSGGYVLGMTAANDISQRHWQRHAGGGQWIRGKSFDTFCPMGPVLALANHGRDPDLAITTSVNGQIRQNSRTGDMIFPVHQLVSYLSRSTTLLPGTVILTGTPEGVGYARKEGPTYLKAGDTVQVHVQNIGTLTNVIQHEPA